MEMILLALALGLAGCLAGVLAGLFGIGGGAVLVPILLAAFGFLGVDPEVSAHLAVGTSLAIIIPTAVRSYRAHRGQGAGNAELLRRWRLWVPLGVVAASTIVPFVSGDVLRIVFAVVASVIAVKMLFNREGWTIAPDLPREGAQNGVGFGIGFVSTFMGIGGGNLNNLFMTSYGQPIHQAVATSAGLGVLIAIPAALGYAIAGWGHPALPPLTLGYIHLLGAALIIPFSYLAAPFGARLAHRLEPRKLELAFGLFLLVVVARMLWSALG
ncbi:sulfite exporter TauE/SafE family protein [Alphaproteobacteria bacterium KMM 3653]|uniref:Probable membrane transporter protein n=2 Tax=Harenicola maris TaxID=2841044 RepID=A0AAP2G4P1_9RHOB|nr:sulfite exporter TauE/SafE family protein [Harenicola maris]